MYSSVGLIRPTLSISDKQIQWTRGFKTEPWRIFYWLNPHTPPWANTGEPSHLTSGTISKSLDMTTGPPYLHTVEWLCSRWLLLLKLNPYYINWSSIYQIKDKLRGSSDTHICFEDLQLYNEPTQTALFMKPHCKNWLPLTSSHTSHLTPHTYTRDTWRGLLQCDKWWRGNRVSWLGQICMETSCQLRSVSVCTKQIIVKYVGVPQILETIIYIYLVLLWQMLQTMGFRTIKIYFIIQA